MPLQIRLAALWVAVLFNMAFADILSLFYPGVIGAVSSGVVEGVAMTPALLLMAALFIEIPVLMILASLMLPPGPSRVAQLIAAPLTALFVIGGGSLKLHYLFFGGVEVALLCGIFWLAWRMDRTPAPTLTSHI